MENLQKALGTLRLGGCFMDAWFSIMPFISPKLVTRQGGRFTAIDELNGPLFPRCHWPQSVMTGQVSLMGLEQELEGPRSACKPSEEEKNRLRMALRIGSRAPDLRELLRQIHLSSQQPPA